ncbi:hypothetical protein RI054_36g137770 [Pseudoscourfieldia marina]
MIRGRKTSPTVRTGNAALGNVLAPANSFQVMFGDENSQPAGVGGTAAAEAVAQQQQQQATAAAISAAALAASAMAPSQQSEQPTTMRYGDDAAVERSDEAFAATLRRIQAEALRLLHERQPKGTANSTSQAPPPPPGPPPSGLAGMPGLTKTATARARVGGVRKQRPKRRAEYVAPPQSVVEAARYASKRDRIVRLAPRVDPGAREVEALMRHYAQPPRPQTQHNAPTATLTVPTRPRSAPPSRAVSSAAPTLPPRANVPLAPPPQRAAERLRAERRRAEAEIEAKEKARAAARALADRARRENEANAIAVRAARAKVALDEQAASQQLQPPPPPNKENAEPTEKIELSFSGLPMTRATAIRKRAKVVKPDEEEAATTARTTSKDTAIRAFDPLSTGGGWSVSSDKADKTADKATQPAGGLAALPTKGTTNEPSAKQRRRPPLPEEARGKAREKAHASEDQLHGESMPGTSTSQAPASAAKMETAKADAARARKDVESLLASLEKPTAIVGLEDVQTSSARKSYDRPWRAAMRKKSADEETMRPYTAPAQLKGENAAESAEKRKSKVGRKDPQEVQEFIDRRRKDRRRASTMAKQDAERLKRIKKARLAEIAQKSREAFANARPAPITGFAGLAVTREPMPESESASPPRPTQARPAWRGPIDLDAANATGWDAGSDPPSPSLAREVDSRPLPQARLTRSKERFEELLQQALKPDSPIADTSKPPTSAPRTAEQSAGAKEALVAKALAKRLSAKIAAAAAAPPMDPADAARQKIERMRQFSDKVRTKRERQLEAQRRQRQKAAAELARKKRRRELKRQRAAQDLMSAAQAAEYVASQAIPVRPSAAFAMPVKKGRAKASATAALNARQVELRLASRQRAAAARRAEALRRFATTVHTPHIIPSAGGASNVRALDRNLYPEKLDQLKHVASRLSERIAVLTQAAPDLLTSQPAQSETAPLAKTNAVKARAAEREAEETLSRLAQDAQKAARELAAVQRASRTHDTESKNAKEDAKGGGAKVTDQDDEAIREADDATALLHAQLAGNEKDADDATSLLHAQLAANEPGQQDAARDEEGTNTSHSADVEEEGEAIAPVEEEELLHDAEDATAALHAMLSGNDPHGDSAAKAPEVAVEAAEAEDATAALHRMLAGNEQPSVHATKSDSGTSSDDGERRRRRRARGARGVPSVARTRQERTFSPDFELSGIESAQYDMNVSTEPAEFIGLTQIAPVSTRERDRTYVESAYLDDESMPLGNAADGTSVFSALLARAIPSASAEPTKVPTSHDAAALFVQYATEAEVSGTAAADEEKRRSDERVAALEAKLAAMEASAKEDVQAAIAAAVSMVVKSGGATGLNTQVATSSDDVAANDTQISIEQRSAAAASAAAVARDAADRGERLSPEELQRRVLTELDLLEEAANAEKHAENLAASAALSRAQAAAAESAVSAQMADALAEQRALLSAASHTAEVALAEERAKAKEELQAAAESAVRTIHAENLNAVKEIASMQVNLAVQQTRQEEAVKSTSVGTEQPVAEKALASTALYTDDFDAPISPGPANKLSMAADAAAVTSDSISDDVVAGMDEARVEDERAQSERSSSIADEIGDADGTASIPGAGRPAGRDSSSSIEDEVDDETVATPPARAGRAKASSSSIAEEISAVASDAHAQALAASEAVAQRRIAEVQADLKVREASAKAQLKKLWASDPKRRNNKKALSEDDPSQMPTRGERLVLMQLAADRADAERSIASVRADLERQRLALVASASTLQGKAAARAETSGAFISDDIAEDVLPSSSHLSGATMVTRGADAAASVATEVEYTMEFDGESASRLSGGANTANAHDSSSFDEERFDRVTNEVAQSQETLVSLQRKVSKEKRKIELSRKEALLERIRDEANQLREELAALTRAKGSAAAAAGTAPAPALALSAQVGSTTAPAPMDSDEIEEDETLALAAEVRPINQTLATASTIEEEVVDDDDAIEDEFADVVAPISATAASFPRTAEAQAATVAANAVAEQARQAIDAALALPEEPPLTESEELEEVRLAALETELQQLRVSARRARNRVKEAALQEQVAAMRTAVDDARHAMVNPRPAAPSPLQAPAPATQRRARGSRAPLPAPVASTVVEDVPEVEEDDLRTVDRILPEVSEMLADSISEEIDSVVEHEASLAEQSKIASELSEDIVVEEPEEDETEEKDETTVAAVELSEEIEVEAEDEDEDEVAQSASEADPVYTESFVDDDQSDMRSSQERSFRNDSALSSEKPTGAAEDGDDSPRQFKIGGMNVVLGGIDELLAQSNEVDPELPVEADPAKETTVAAMAHSSGESVRTSEAMMSSRDDISADWAPDHSTESAERSAQASPDPPVLQQKEEGKAEQDEEDQQYTDSFVDEDVTARSGLLSSSEGRTSSPSPQPPRSPSEPEAFVIGGARVMLGGIDDLMGESDDGLQASADFAPSEGTTTTGPPDVPPTDADEDQAVGVGALEEQEEGEDDDDDDDMPPPLEEVDDDDDVELEIEEEDEAQPISVESEEFVIPQGADLAEAETTTTATTPTPPTTEVASAMTNELLSDSFHAMEEAMRTKDERQEDLPPRPASPAVAITVPIMDEQLDMPEPSISAGGAEVLTVEYEDEFEEDEEDDDDDDEVVEQRQPPSSVVPSNQMEDSESETDSDDDVPRPADPTEGAASKTARVDMTAAFVDAAASAMRDQGSTPPPLVALAASAGVPEELRQALVDSYASLARVPSPDDSASSMASAAYSAMASDRDTLHRAAKRRMHEFAKHSDDARARRREAQLVVAAQQFSANPPPPPPPGDDLGPAQSGQLHENALKAMLEHDARIDEEEESYEHGARYVAAKKALIDRVAESIYEDLVADLVQSMQSCEDK